MDIEIKRVIDRCKGHIRVDCRASIVRIQKLFSGSVLKYEEPSDYMKAWKDLVLRDSKGEEIARVMTFGTFGNSDLRFSGKHYI